MRNLKDELALAMRTAGAELLERPDFAIHNKGVDYDFVTDMDVRMQEVMRIALKSILPEAAFRSEEDLSEQPTAGQYYWLLDPIDGTTNFVRDLHMSCIAVALCQDETVVAGAIYVPWGDEFFYAQRGLGAWCNDTCLHVSNRTMHQAVACFGQGYGTRAQSFARMRPVRDRILTECVAGRALGSAEICLAYVAAGRIDVYVEQSIGPWDHAAGGILVQEAGGVITNWQGLPCNLHQRDSLVAGNAVIQADMLVTAKVADQLRFE